MSLPTVPAKTIVSSRQSGGFFGADYTMNIYRGCCHGCVYCDSRSDCYRIENFDTVHAKENAHFVIERDLRAKRTPGVVITGSMSDPYNPFEAASELTRGALRLLAKYGFGVVVDTKSPLVTRDIDMLRDIAKHAPVLVNVTVTTADDTLCRQLERHVAPTSERLAAVKELSEAGVPCGLLLMPVLPFINDTEENIVGIVELASASGARWIYSGGGFGVTLRQNQRDWFYARLDELFPGVKQQYIETFGDSYVCTSKRSGALWTRFASLCDRHGLLYRMADILRETRRGYGERQLSLF